jgi:small subunit ribosomal protein S3
MSVYRYFVQEGSRRTEIDEFLQNELKRAGYSKVELAKSPLGTRVVIYAAKPGMVIGRRGQSIRDLTKILEERFGIENPQISVAPIEVPELDPRVVASQVATALQRGIHFRRAAYWAIQRTMASGALGVEVAIRGKLTTERARYEKYRAGYLLRVGNPVIKSVRRAVVDVQLKQGLFGINVQILPPNVDFPDRPTLRPEGAQPAAELPAAGAEASVAEEEEDEDADSKTS